MADNGPPAPDGRLEIEARLGKVQAYGKPRQVWVDDGHVFVEGYDGTVVSMTPEVAIELGRLISNAGADSLVNKVMDKARDAEPAAPQAD